MRRLADIVMLVVGGGGGGGGGVITSDPGSLALAYSPNFLSQLGQAHSSIACSICMQKVVKVVS